MTHDEVRRLFEAKNAKREPCFVNYKGKRAIVLNATPGVGFAVYDGTQAPPVRLTIQLEIDDDVIDVEARDLSVER